jgi:hypothetical protein
MPGGIKHLVECHCILPQFKKRESIVFHKFTVYSKLTEKGDVIEKTVQCNNCNVIHKVSKLCNSRILGGRDEYSAGMSIEDLSVQLDSKISNILSNSNCDIATWEHVLDVIEEERWGENIILNRNIIDSQQNVKVLNIFENLKIKLTTKVIKDEIGQN